ncbi:MAG: nickel pincer cofactor biosynthesis protein LarB [Acidimicrobiales bacterium]
MDEPTIIQLIEDIRSGACSPEDALRRLRRLPFADLGFARVDHHRGIRQSVPEAVYAQGKTAEQCSAIVGELLAEPAGDRPTDRLPGESPHSSNRHSSGGASPPNDQRREPTSGEDVPRFSGPPVILTRADAEQVEVVCSDHPGGLVTETGRATGDDRLRGTLSTVVWRPAPPRPARVLVVTAGTSDLPVARECASTLTALGIRPTVLADCGVAGVHRLLASVDELAEADAVVVVAGMEGALASLVGGITPAPVVAVPTSTGYGAGLEGITALLAMHASCAAGLAVVGIDNGFGAACAVARMLP